MQYWDGSRFPRLTGLDELKLRKKMFFEWINSPTNKIDWKDVFSSRWKEKNRKVEDNLGKSFFFRQFHGWFCLCLGILYKSTFFMSNRGAHLCLNEVATYMLTRWQLMKQQFSEWLHFFGNYFCYKFSKLTVLCTQVLFMLQLFMFVLGDSVHKHYWWVRNRRPTPCAPAQVATISSIDKVPWTE